MTIVDKIVDYESGNMTEILDVSNFFCELINTGIINSLQGTYQRTAKWLMSEGYIYSEDGVIYKPRTGEGHDNSLTKRQE